MNRISWCLNLGLGLVITCSWAGLAHSQYKIVGPDGRVTYTDRLSPENAASAQPMRVQSGNQLLDQSSTWPQELREAARRYPVTLYTQRNCIPCDSARSLLTTRGVPFAEKTVTSRADISAFSSLAGGDGAVLPALTIGSQFIKGLNAGEWHGYLDAAGYPKTSRLPANYRLPAAAPLSPAVPGGDGSKSEPDGTQGGNRRSTEQSPAESSSAAPPLRF